MQPPKFSELTPKVVLGIAAHPDDLDFSSAGTMAKFAAAGADVHYLILTDGGKGSSDPSITSAELTKIRHQEQQDAVKALGGVSAQFLDYPDGELEVTLELKKKVVRVIRQIKPDIVITLDPTVLYYPELGFINHTDHRAAGYAAIDAVFPLARDHLSFHDLYSDEHLEPHKVKTLLLTNFDKQNFYVDITDTLETKFSAWAAHVSQYDDLEEIKTRQRQMAEHTGSKCGVKYAEGFMRLEMQP